MPVMLFASLTAGRSGNMDAGKPRHADLPWACLAHSCRSGPVKRATECTGPALSFELVSWPKNAKTSQSQYELLILIVIFLVGCQACGECILVFPGR